MEVYKFIIYGKVQGVYYRKFIAQKAMQKQLEGYIKNLSNGTVEVVAVLFDDDLENFKAILNEGSPLSFVENIEMSILDSDDLVYDGFEIRYS